MTGFVFFSLRRPFSEKKKNEENERERWRRAQHANLQSLASSLTLSLSLSLSFETLTDSSPLLFFFDGSLEFPSRSNSALAFFLFIARHLRSHGFQQHAFIFFNPPSCYSHLYFRSDYALSSLSLAPPPLHTAVCLLDNGATIEREFKRHPVYC